MFSSFSKDLKRGGKAEEFVLEKLRKEFPTLERINGYCPDYDFKDNNGYTLELKYDPASKSTGNVVIEYKHGGVPSGISTSKAIEWIVIYYNNGWKYMRCSRGDLKAFLKNNWKSLRKYVGNGDKSSLAIIPVDVLEECLPYDELINM